MPDRNASHDEQPPGPSLRVPVTASFLVLGAWVAFTSAATPLAPVVRAVVDRAEVMLGLDIAQAPVAEEPT